MEKREEKQLLDQSKTENTRENLNKAIKSCIESLNVYTIDKYPKGYAMVHNNLATAYADLAKIENTQENLDKAIGSYKESLKVYTIDNYPQDYELVESILGFSYLKLIEIEGPSESLCRLAKDSLTRARSVTQQTNKDAIKNLDDAFNLLNTLCK